MNDPVVSVVVVNYRSGNDLGTCLAALAASAPAFATEVIAVDNASGDESFVPAREAGAAGTITVVESEQNLGLAGGVNLALPLVRGRQLVVLNPDVTPQSGWLEPLVAAMQERPRVGVVCPLIEITGTKRINSAGQHIHVSGLGFNRLLDRPLATAGETPHEVPGFHGACFMIDTELLRAVGGWDETGFLYQEDVALSWSVRLAGRTVECVPASRVSHDYHLTMYPEKLYLLERNRWMLLLTHLCAWSRALLAPALLLSELLVWGLCLLRGPKFIAAKWRAVRWVRSHRAEIDDWRSRVGKFRKAKDRELLRAMRWSYPLTQLFVLGGEREQSARQPPGGLPTR